LYESMFKILLADKLDIIESDLDFTIIDLSINNGYRFRSP